MKRFLFAIALLLLAGSQAFAQSSTLTMARAVTACGGQSLTNGKNYPVTIDLTGALCTGSGGGGSTSVTQGTTPWVVSGQGTAGTAATGVVTVQGIASMTPLTANPGTAANWGIGATAAAPVANAQQTGAVTGSATTGGKLQNIIQCDSHVFKHITSATDTLAVQGVTSQIIYVCGWRSRAAGDATWYLENTASTNANCSSSNTQLTGVATETANSGEVFAPPFWTGLKNTVSNGLCINSTGTGGVDIDIWYTQF